MSEWTNDTETVSYETPSETILNLALAVQALTNIAHEASAGGWDGPLLLMRGLIENIEHFSAEMKAQRTGV